MPEGPRIRPEELSSFDGVIVDCRAGPERGGYDREHLVGSVRADLEHDLAHVGDPAVGGRHPLPSIRAWTATLGRWGIGPQTPVAVVDGQGGGLYAARAWWMLRAIGHRKVWVVDGGYDAVVAAGVAVDAEAVHPEDAGPYPASAWSLPTVPIDVVDRVRADPGWRVLDARSAARWRGEVEPIDPVPGRIEGSVNLPWESTVDADGRLRPRAELEALLDAAIGTTALDRVVVHCGSGVTACQLVQVFEAVGREVPALFVGSYSEWCRR